MSFVEINMRKDAEYLHKTCNFDTVHDLAWGVYELYVEACGSHIEDIPANREESLVDLATQISSEIFSK